MSYTTEIIDELISRPKRISKPPTREFKEENRHRRKDMELTGVDGGDFIVFIRQSLEFPEDFSVGLAYMLDVEKEYCSFATTDSTIKLMMLLRCRICTFSIICTKLHQRI